MKRGSDPGSPLPPPPGEGGLQGRVFGLLAGEERDLVPHGVGRRGGTATGGGRSAAEGEGEVVGGTCRLRFDLELLKRGGGANSRPASRGTPQQGRGPGGRKIGAINASQIIVPLRGTQRGAGFSQDRCPKLGEKSLGVSK